MEWILDNWFWVLIFIFFVLMHLFGHGSHGMHSHGGRHKHGDDNHDRESNSRKEDKTPGHHH